MKKKAWYFGIVSGYLRNSIKKERKEAKSGIIYLY
jgi:hypothetical protein